MSTSNPYLSMVLGGLLGGASLVSCGNDGNTLGTVASNGGTSTTTGGATAGTGATGTATSSGTVGTSTTTGSNGATAATGSTSASSGGRGDAATDTSATVDATNAGGDAAADAAPFTLAGLDAVCSGGPGVPITGRQVLAFLHSPYVGTYSPPTQRPTGYPWTGPTTSSPITVEANYANGPLTCMPGVPYDCCAGCPCKAPDYAKIAVDLDVTVTTSNGLFNDSFMATATYTSTFGQVDWRGTLPASKAMGTYRLSAGTRDQVELQFIGTFNATQNGGSIAEVIPSTLSISGGTWTTSGTDAGADAGKD